MTENVRLNFLDWKPDMDDFGGEPGSLVTADNLLHDTEGYKQVTAATQNGAFGTLTRVATEMVCKPIGSSGQVLCAWVDVTTATPSGKISIGFGEAGPALVASGSMGTLTSAGDINLTGFQVAELGDKVFAVARATGLVTGSAITHLDLAGFFTITALS